MDTEQEYGWDVERYPLEPLFQYLEGPEGCNFWRLDEVDPETGPDVTWRCDSTLRMTRAWLRRHRYPVAPIIAFCKEHGAECDCDMVFDVKGFYGGTDEEGGEDAQ